jgi:uncharacterized protein
VEAKDTRMQFVYVLKLTPRLLKEEAWTERDKQIVGQHFRRLQQLHKDGKVVLVGKTENDNDPEQFGLVIFEADSEAQARKIMESDDAVREKIMTAKLFPFRAVLRGERSQ